MSDYEEDEDICRVLSYNVQMDDGLGGLFTS
jgi:hypothetical protein